MNAANLLKEIEDALVFACKYSEDREDGRIMMTKARAKTIIADIRANRAKAQINKIHNIKL